MGTVVAMAFALGAIIGLPIGMIIARAQRGWRDYRTVKATLPKLKGEAWLLIWGASGRTLLLVAGVVLAVVWALWGPQSP